MIFFRVHGNGKGGITHLGKPTFDPNTDKLEIIYTMNFFAIEFIRIIIAHVLFRCKTEIIFSFPSSIGLG